MDLAPDQQFQIELEKARADGLLALERRRAKLESVRMARDTLIENARSKPADSREVTAADITAFASALEAHINS